jgi:hypothetical protein
MQPGNVDNEFVFGFVSFNSIKETTPNGTVSLDESRFLYERTMNSFG